MVGLLPTSPVAFAAYGWFLRSFQQVAIYDHQ